MHVCRWHGEEDSGMVVTQVGQLSGHVFNLETVQRSNEDVESLRRVDVTEGGLSFLQCFHLRLNDHLDAHLEAVRN